tara:strand:+ start:339 stop:563 length:225 start_codon:yes stop_codon:yes gene_type:complete
MECKGKELFENKVVDGGNSGETEDGLPTQVAAGKKLEARGRKLDDRRQESEVGSEKLKANSYMKKFKKQHPFRD